MRWDYISVEMVRKGDQRRIDIRLKKFNNFLIIRFPPPRKHTKLQTSVSMRRENIAVYVEKEAIRWDYISVELVRKQAQRKIIIRI